MAKRCKLFNLLFAAYAQPFPGHASSLEKVIAGIDSRKEIADFVQKILTSGGRARLPTQFISALPCAASMIDQLHEEADLKIALYSEVPPYVPPTDSIVNLQAFALAVPAQRAHRPSITGAFSAITSLFTGASASPSVDTPALFGANASAPTMVSPRASATAKSVAPPMLPIDDPPLLVVRALYDFSTEEPNDLRFLTGDLILVTMRPTNGPVNLSDTGEWWMGRVLHIANGTNYVVNPDFDRQYTESMLLHYQQTQSAENPVIIPRSPFDGSFPSNYVEVVELNAKVTLRHVLEVKLSRYLLTEFLKSEYADENVKFWMEVESFRLLAIEEKAAFPDKDNPANDRVMKEAKRICDSFVAASAPHMVNLNSTNRNNILKNVALPFLVSAGLFDDAQTEIFKLLDSDSFPRFQRSPYWQTLMARAAK